MPAKPPSAKVMLHPSYTPGQSPVNWQAMDAERFRDLWSDARISDYEEILRATGCSDYGLRGCFIVKDMNPGVGNLVLVKLTLRDGEQEVAHTILTASSMLELAGHLIGFAIACANVNNEHAVISDQLMALFSQYLNPAFFKKYVAALTEAASEELQTRAAIKSALRK